MFFGCGGHLYGHVRRPFGRCWRGFGFCLTDDDHDGGDGVADSDDGHDDHDGGDPPSGDAGGARGWRRRRHPFRPM